MAEVEVDMVTDMEVDKVADKEADMVTNMANDKKTGRHGFGPGGIRPLPVDRVADMVTDMVADKRKLANMKLDMVADTEVYKVADMVADNNKFNIDINMEVQFGVRAGHFFDPKLTGLAQ